MARREPHQPHSAPLKPHMPADARIRESDGNPHCRQNPSFASLAYPHAGHDTRRNTATRQTQPSAQPATHHRTPHTPPGTTRHTQPGAHLTAHSDTHRVPHQISSLCNPAESQRFSESNLNISPPKPDSASFSDSPPDITDGQQSGIVGIPGISQSTHLTRPAAKSQYLIQTGVHHELLRHFSKKLSAIKPEREKLRPRHGTHPIGLAATSQPSPSGISQLTPKARRTTPAARGDNERMRNAAVRVLPNPKDITLAKAGASCSNQSRAGRPAVDDWIRMSSRKRRAPQAGARKPSCTGIAAPRMPRHT